MTAQRSMGHLEPAREVALTEDFGAAEAVGGPFDSKPEVTLDRVASYDGPVLVDLDETLYLRNSTEDFIDLARPGLIAVVLLKLVDLLEPWRWSGGAATRDVWRVQMIRLLFPWTLRLWRARAPELARKFANPALVHVLQSRSGPTIVVTVGFEPIVAPLVGILLPGARTVAARLNTFADRRRGKLACATEALGETLVSQALVVTDSLQDLPLLQACAFPLRTIWPDAEYRHALNGIYLPGLYMALIKRPGEHYFRRAVLQEDYVLWVVSSVALASSPLHHAAGLLLLIFSFWVVYEHGYVDNDLIALHREEDPKLSVAFKETSVATPTWQPWIWALVLGLAGIGVLRGPAAPRPLDLLAWAAVLVGTYLWFRFYNRSVKPARAWMYVVLQLARNAAFAVLVPIMPIGAMALAANTNSRWLHYYIYRACSTSWPQDQYFGLIRVVFFLILALLLSVSAGWQVIHNWTAVALFGWAVFRARNELTKVYGRFAWLKPRARAEAPK